MASIISSDEKPLPTIQAYISDIKSQQQACFDFLYKLRMIATKVSDNWPLNNEKTAGESNPEKPKESTLENDLIDIITNGGAICRDFEATLLHLQNYL